MKYDKESYITDGLDLNKWKDHTNVKILNEYKNFITGSVLDVGCNTGVTTYWLKDYNVSRITGLDININAIEYAKNFFKEVLIPNNFINLDLTKDVLNEKFDTIISFHTLEHIYEEDVDTFLSNIYSMLKTDGYFIISIPHEKAYKSPTHVAFYNEVTLNNVMVKNGFTIIESLKDDRWDEKNLLTALYKK